MVDVAPFRLLTEEEYASLSIEEKLDYLKHAIEAVQARRVLGPSPASMQAPC
jgi:hypothetical protein